MERPPRLALDHCLTLVPAATMMRTHGLYQTSNLFHLICDHYPQIMVDCSLLLPFARHLEPTYLYSGRSNRRLIRVPTFFQDNVAWRWPGWRGSLELLNGPGLKVFSFHPIHVALNSANEQAYEDLKASLDAPLYNASREQVDRHAVGGPGTREFLERLTDALDRGTVAGLLDIASGRNATKMVR